MIEWDKRSERSLGFVRTCLSNCRESHLDCKPLNRSKREHRVPTRLLHIQSASSTGYIRLIDFTRLVSAPGAFKGYAMLDYAILSYCWGGPQSLTLTQGNIEILLDRIPVVQLGQTIQDAITVCNKLHISFLWIDALCILQGSSADMQHELSMMSTYYQHGVLTICAASAQSSAEGFLSSGEHNSYAVGPFEMMFEEGQRRLPESPKKRNFTQAFDIDEIRRDRFSHMEKSGELQKMAGSPTQHAVQLFKLRDERPAEPIASRAWTFQEAILSTRLLIFASRQVYWCCHEHYVGCGGIHSFEKTQVVHPDCPGEQSKACICGVSLIRRIDPPDLVPGIFTLGYRNTLSTDTQWDMLVAEFSGRALTMASDKLVAFSAAASYFDTLFRARWPSVQYVAGLWYSDESPLSFLRQLLWSSENPETAYRAPIFRAPTWSWASIDGQIKQFDKRQMLLDSHISLEIVKVVTRIAVHTAPFGAVDSGRLMVRGKLRSLAPFQDTGSLPLGQYPIPGWKVLPDTPNEEAFISSNINRLYLLEVIPYTVTNLALSPSPIGIVLCELDSPEETSEGYISTFKRMGTFSFPGDRELGVAANIFDDCEKEDICIL
jgi:Heterokaryon incompatibility protein (HET)